MTRQDLSIVTTQNTMATYFVNLGLAGTFSEDYKNTNFSWKFGGQYDVTDDIMVYTTYGKGYKGAGFNDAVTKPNQVLRVDPEVAKSLEAGIKTSWFGGKLIANLGLYRTKFDNYQVQSLDTALQTFVIQNAASLTTKGAELSIMARPFRGFSLNGSATLLDTKFGDFQGAQCTPDQSQPCNPDGTYNARGTRLPTAPKFAGTVQAMYEGDISDTLRYFIEGNLYHRSAINYRVGEPASTRVGATNILGASIGLKTERFTFRLFCRNCTDNHVPTFINPVAGDATNGIASSVQQWGLNSFRNIGISINAEF